MAEQHLWLIGPTRLAAHVVHSAVLGRLAPSDRCPDGMLDAGVVVLNCALAAGRPEAAATCGQLVRRIYPWLVEHDPAAVSGNITAFYLLAPELLDPVLDEDPPRPRAGCPLSAGEVLRLEHGLTELFYAWGSNGAGTVVFYRADKAGALDMRLIECLTRRVPAEVVRLILCTPDPSLPTGFRAALRTHTVTVDLRPRPPHGRHGPSGPTTLRRSGHLRRRPQGPPGRDPCQ